MQKQRWWSMAGAALVSGLEISRLQRHRSMADVPVEGVLMLNISSLALLMFGQLL